MSGVFKLYGRAPEAERVRVAAVLARDAQGRVLAQLRDDAPHVAGAGLWSLFGGRVDAGETLEAAAAREFAEETGLALDPAEFRPLAKVASALRADWMIYIFQLDRPVAPCEIRLGEGAGFAFIAPDKLGQFDFIANYKQFFEKFFD